MKKVFVTAMMIGATASLASVAFAQTTVIDDNFESYIDQAALEAVWTQDTTNKNVTLQEDPTSGTTPANKYAHVPLGTSVADPAGRISRDINIQPTDDAPLEVSFDIRPGGSALGRSYMQLEAPGTNLVDFGLYNNVAGAGWSARVLGGGAPGAWSIVGGTRKADEWTNLKVLVKTRSVSFYANGILLATQARTNSDFPAFTKVELGFSGGGSAVTTDYDNLLVRVVAAVNDWNLY